MNVLTVTNTLDFGGTAKNAIILHNNISKHANTSFLSFEDGVRRKQVNGDCRVIEPENLLDHVQEKDADIVHFHGASIEPFSQEELQKIPNIVKTANFGWPDYNEEIDLFLFPSKMTLLRYLTIDGRNEKKKCRLLYHPVPSIKAPAEPKNHSGKKLRIGMLGRPDSGKRSSIGFKAFMKILKEDSEREGFLLNPPKYRVKKLRKNNILNQVSIKKNIPVGAISNFYSNIDALIHSSAPGESFGYVLAEAQKSETVPITNSTPMRDNAQIEIIENGKSGYIANNVGSFVKAARKVQEGDLEGQECTENMLDLNPKDITKKLLAMYRRLLNDGQVQQDLELKQFEKTYRSRLKKCVGHEGWNHRLERKTWAAARTYCWSRQSYDILRAPFKPGRKAHKIRKKCCPF